MRKNPLIFKHEEYEFLHRVYLVRPSKGKFYDGINRKKGVGLNKDQILFIKKKFSEWKQKNPNELLWMGIEAE
ncbi:MAG: hypothetical protein Q8R18_04715 [bacterium]|nr:hypothetical protein [bacterium]